MSPAKAGAKAQKAGATKKVASKKTSARAGGQRPARPQAAKAAGARAAPDIERTAGRAAGSAGQAIPRLKTRYRD